MQRYFIKEQLENIIILQEDDIFHAKKVMRGKNGDNLIALANNDKVYRCEFVDIDNGKATILEELDQNCELDVSVTLIYAMPKGDKFEMVLQKATELGVSRIVPLQTRRCVVKLDAQKFSKKMQRYQKIVKEASEQSYRNHVPIIEDIQTLSTVEGFLSTYNLVAYEESAKTNRKSTFHQVMSDIAPNESITIIVGSEGGFDVDEIETLEKMGVKRCSLGKRILRSETAPLYMLSVIGFFREEM